MPVHMDPVDILLHPQASLSLSLSHTHTHTHTHTDYTGPFLKDFIYLLEEEGGREGEKHQCVVASCPPPTGDLTWPTTQSCVLTGNWTGDPLVCRPALSPLSQTSQSTLVLFYLPSDPCLVHALLCSISQRGWPPACQWAWKQILQLRMTASPADSSTTASWENLSHNHPGKPLPDSWPSETDLCSQLVSGLAQRWEAHAGDW